ncbi:hypothetical protein M427DRAFT_391700 [Gonapodya prolifera JEL478]|uniref:Uncharacterized protein n=1 Tax=Gonapodya prolifera (strain JEL478) TaxID=1344416 RepID=A0A139A7H8_GONPJ|nr:hypothetical protein M427DRAFT_391700 [Gonapodya prolifera JEL478]|eukprot:KXS12757.1 hypothetical protein M427DRAFT_391700 [Gonapodya prolifera JEL478]
MTVLHLDVFHPMMASHNLWRFFCVGPEITADTRSRITSLTIPFWSAQISGSNSASEGIERESRRREAWRWIGGVVDHNIPVLFPNLRHLGNIPIGYMCGASKFPSWPNHTAEAPGQADSFPGSATHGVQDTAHAQVKTMRVILEHDHFACRASSTATAVDEKAALPQTLRDLVSLAQKYPNLSHLEVVVPEYLIRYHGEDWCEALHAVPATGVELVVPSDTAWNTNGTLLMEVARLMKGSGKREAGESCWM